MTEEHLDNFRALRQLPEDRDVDAGADGDDYGPGDINIHNIMDGSTRIDISHAGGEFVATLQDGIEREMANMSTKKKSAPDYRVRDDRTQNLVNGWSVQMERLVKAYMIWCAEADMGPSRERTPRMVEEIEITVVDLYETQRMDVELDAGGAGVAAALIKQGLMPCAPWKPSVAIATRVLELYRTTHIRCPQLAIQSFVKSLCDLHGGDPSNPCSGRWKNMINDVTSKMWGIFDETGIFLASVGMGFALVVADMVRSGELSKYPLAVVEALKILQTEPALKRWMQEEGVEDYDTFHVWLEEEKEYLLGLDAGLPKKRELTLEMEYLQKLVNLEGSQKRVTAIRAAERAAQADGADYSPAPISNVARRHAIEQRNRDIELVEDLEQKLGVETRWTSNSPQWTATDAALKKHKYLDALDEIEQIILARLFEMTKVHQSGTGYKMRSHIAKALQARSKAIRNAIERYNKVALSMEPPMPTLDWDQVVNYGFLGDFDLLRDTTDSISSRPWTRRSYRLAMDSYFKILRAREEIQRLNIEIKRVVTWIDNEDRSLDIANSVADQTCITCIGFWALAKVPGFTGSVVPGISIEAREVRRQARQAQHAMSEGRAMDVDEGDEVDEIVVEERDRWEQERDEGWEDEIEDEGEQAREENIAALMYQMSVLAVDREGMSGINPGLN
ncbi:hypothetical protein B0H14DRAFT_3656102 [Mycena olivaceomarginata]|nr:hypothetical protein B0H14DRAFT_3656102 [Mycena olivaceomarginata]